MREGGRGHGGEGTDGKQTDGLCGGESAISAKKSPNLAYESADGCKRAEAVPHTCT